MKVTRLEKFVDKNDFTIIRTCSNKRDLSK